MKITINGLCVGLEDRGEGMPVLLIHGFPLTRRMWTPQLEALSNAGFRAIAPDLRGFGESEAGTERVTMETYADDIVAVLDSLGIEKAVVAGMSMGGYVLMSLLERHPERVSAACFVVTRAGADDEPGRMRRTALAGEVSKGNAGIVSEAFEKILFADATVEKAPRVVEEVRGWMTEASSEGLVNALLAMRDRKDYTDFLAKIGIPSLLIGAEEDRAIPVEHLESLASKISGSSLVVLPEAGHMVNLEQPDAFNEAMIAFLKALR